MPNRTLELKNADLKDSEDLYQWRNHPIVRKGSFQPDPFSREEHDQWLRKKYADPNTTIYMAYHEGQKIGAIRFEDMPDAARVNVMLNPDFIGKGFGVRLIESGTKKFMDEQKPCKPIIAEIKRDNEASRKAFEQAGFKMSHSTYIFGS